MGFIKNDEIVGYHMGGQLVCTECVTKEELAAELTEEQVITSQEVEGEDLYFCDRCKKQITEI